MLEHMRDSEFKQLIENNYEGADIYELWNSYTLIENRANFYKRNGWHDAREAELEAEVLVDLMRRIPPEKKKGFYNEMLGDYIHLGEKGVSIDNLIEFCENLESLELFKKRILDKNG